MSNLVKPGAAPKRNYKIILPNEPKSKFQRIVNSQNIQFDPSDYKYVPVSKKRSKPKTFPSEQNPEESRFKYAQRILDETVDFHDIDDAIESICEKFAPDFKKIKQPNDFLNNIKKKSPIRWNVCKFFNIKRTCRYGENIIHHQSQNDPSRIMSHFCLICLYLFGETFNHPSRKCEGLLALDQIPVLSRPTPDPNVEHHNSDHDDIQVQKPGTSSKKPKSKIVSKKAKKAKKDSKSKKIDIDQAAAALVRQLVEKALKEKEQEDKPTTRNKRIKNYRIESSSSPSDSEADSAKDAKTGGNSPNESGKSDEDSGSENRQENHSSSSSQDG